ncbi:hypothetical protein [Herbaspirillum frisingense]|uniref:hypothetical protein n=1 Tax=Herbaspirillum frisingense TaxID=92645 RepID=UPI0039B0BE02
MNTDPIQAALKEILAEKQDHVAGSIAHQRMERAEGALRGLLPAIDTRKPLSPAMSALIESGQVEDGDGDLLEPQGQALAQESVKEKAARMSAECRAEAAALEDMQLPAHEPTIALAEMLDGYLPDDREEAWEAIQAYADVHARAAVQLNAKDASHLALPAEPAQFQQRVRPWMMACFGEAISNDLQERNHRFFEESTELVQSTGMTQSEAHQLVDYVYGRPVGEPVQEVGGVMVTLAALCLAAKMDMHAAGETELARIWTKVDQIRAKQAAKPKHSPLPVTQPSPAATAFPDALTPDLSYVLGMPNFRCAPFAAVFREAGHDIPCKAEAEQAFVIHRMVRAVLQHGAGWDAAFAADLRTAAHKVKTALAAKDKPC